MKKSGFTLAEVMVALTVSSIVITSAVSTLQIGMDVSRKTGLKRNSLENCRSALDVICRDLRGAHLSSNQSWSLFRGENAQDGDLDLDTLSFTSLVNNPHRTGERTSDYAEVGYYIDRDPGTLEEWLVRRYDAGPDDDPLEGGNTSLAGYQTAAMDVWYFKDGEWWTEWDSRQDLPTAVRISISTLIDPDRDVMPSNLITLSAIVWLPYGEGQ